MFMHDIILVMSQTILAKRSIDFENLMPEYHEKTNRKNF